MFASRRRFSRGALRGMSEEVVGALATTGRTKDGWLCIAAGQKGGIKQLKPQECSFPARHYKPLRA
ncbi:hypothetical protein CWRG_02838 [Chthonomonas calidirosea]|nr:hypothetical protein CWRG_02838 [Chthonomonas calidirosea]